MARSSFLAAALAAAAFTTAAWGLGGPDLVICRVGGTSTSTGFAYLGVSSGIRAFAADSVICNYGDMPCGWDAVDPEPDNNHPILSQTLFRLRNGRLNQIGQSWLKHAGNATQANECGLTCQGGGNFMLLGVGCCDAYSALTNGTQFTGPKSEINPVTGVYPYPFCSPADGGMTCPSYDATVGRRLQVHDTDLDTGAGVQYFLQMHLITPDEINVAIPRTDFNNCSYRPVTIASNHMGGTWAGVTIDSLPAIKAWKLNGLGPGIPDPDVVEAIIDVPSDGRFYLAGKATNLGGGQWQYEYAVQNYNSDRAAQSFTVPLPLGHGSTNIFFHDVDYHSGEPYLNDDWSVTSTSKGLTWSTLPYTTNVNANALRWDTMYNFRFQCSKPPAMKRISMGLFKPPALPRQPTIVAAFLPVPDNDCNGNGIADSVDIANATSLDANLDGVPDECPLPCRADIDGDHSVSVNDLLAVITTWGTCAFPANCPADISPAPAGNGSVDVNDLLQVITAWGVCP